MNIHILVVLEQLLFWGMVCKGSKVGSLMVIQFDYENQLTRVLSIWIFVVNLMFEIVISTHFMLWNFFTVKNVF